MTSFIKWISTDEDGSFNHIGQVVSADQDFTTFVNADGLVMVVPNDDGELTPIAKPRGWSLKAESVSKPISATKKPVRSKKTPGGKLPMIIELLESHKPSTRKEAIALIVEHGFSTQAGASTYYNSAKKHLVN